MSAQRKVIITCAPTGSIHTPSMSQYLPVTPEEIADAGIAAAEAYRINVAFRELDGEKLKAETVPLTGSNCRPLYYH